MYHQRKLRHIFSYTCDDREKGESLFNNYTFTTQNLKERKGEYLLNQKKKKKERNYPNFSHDLRAPLHLIYQKISNSGIIPLNIYIL